ncbi:MAG: SDR family oxidoreductase [Pseudomonadota bacterium]
MNIAVTASNGMLGREIIKTLKKLEPNHTIIGLARSPEKASDLGIEIRPGDYDNSDVLKTSLQGIDAVLLVSGKEEPAKRIQQHRNVIQAAKNAGVKKIVYTSIQGAESGTAFSPVVQSNRQTEQDIKESGLEWVIGRNGIYIEPDIEYIDNYQKSGVVSNCAGDAKCGYTTRQELSFAYAKLLVEDKHYGNTYNLHGECITQSQLVEYLNQAFGLSLSYQTLSVEEYQQERIAELGDFLGTIIAGIYKSILDGYMDNTSDFLQAAGREHVGWEKYFMSLNKQ